MAKDSTSDKNSRLYLLGAMLLLWCVAICGRLVYLQIFSYGKFVKQAGHQQQRAIPVAAKRGVIYDRAGHELAMSVLVDSAFAVPTEVKDLPTAVSLITRITGDDYNVVLADCRAHKTFCWVARKASDETIERINSLKLQGIHFQKEPKRFYPARDLAAQVLGSVGMEDSGQSGIEHEFDDELRGRAGKMFISVDARKQWFADVETQPDPGDNLVLTIDKNIQYIAEKELEQAIHDTQAISGTVIVENPHTGEILALANRPTFNPNSRKQITPGALTNRAVSYVYEPGSTFKLVTISAALEEKVTNPNEVFDCQMGAIVYNGMRIRDSKPHGLLPVWGVLAESSDVGAIKIALRLGEDRFYKYIRAYGFGQQTGIELPGETRGLTKPVSRWSKVSIAAISMGQEIGISPIQLAGLISTFANDGVWVAPRILTGTLPPQSDPKSALQTVAFHPGASHRVISPYTAAEMRSMMQKVVLEGTGRKAILEGYSSAGKTGTAQKVDPETGAYSKTKYIGSFAGFAPVNSPQIVVAVILDSAVGLHQGGQVSAPVFQRISQQVLEYLHVPHDLPLAPKHQLLMAKLKDKDLDEGTPDHPGEPLETAEVNSDSSEGAKVPRVARAAAPASADGVIVQAAMRESVPAGAGAGSSGQAPAKAPGSDASAPSNLPATGTVVLDVEQGGIEVPSFVGKTVRGAVEAAQDAGLELDAVGSGLARQQTPAAGAHVAAGARVTVQFGR
ncbi:MAG TPA: penicillin-binding transpeptidase domain-containing protein [Candidatus Sulfotelmatobacter sp.]|jgi:cell division protein FtsI (penicillin-binding protein 3)|nr:penicillin-binding transpeptidase domain-containing protein [Candidatus Sulfotelmatobacter sp.]